MDKRCKEILYKKEEILKIVDNVTKSINDYYKNETQPVVLFGLLKGCINFFGHIMTKLDFELTNMFIKTSITNGANSNNEVSIDYGLFESVEGKKILIVEDVIDSAITLSKVIAILKEKGAIDVKVVTLLDKVNGRKVPLKPDWTIIESNTKDWLVGWGLDVNEWGRRFPYIATVKDEFK